MMKFKKRYIYILLILTALTLSVIDIFTGSSLFSIKETAQALFSEETSSIKKIIIDYRLPKIIAAIIAGASIGLCGLQMQTLFKNPLADPYILGISTGAGLGVAVFTMGISFFGVSGNFLTNLGTAGAALAGAAAITMVILYISGKFKDTLSILVFGIMISGIGSALINLLQYWAPDPALKTYVLWTMGSFSGLNIEEACTMGILALTGIILSVTNIKNLNALLMGSDYVSGLGINEKRIRKKILISSTLLAGSITAFCGPIGFLGIAIPHVCRMIFRTANHRTLVPATILAGISAMLATDIISQSCTNSGIIPINTISAILGIPVIILIIIKNNK